MPDRARFGPPTATPSPRGRSPSTDVVTLQTDVDFEGWGLYRGRSTCQGRFCGIWFTAIPASLARWCS